MSVESVKNTKELLKALEEGYVGEFIEDDYDSEFFAQVRTIESVCITNCPCAVLLIVSNDASRRVIAEFKYTLNEEEIEHMRYAMESIYPLDWWTFTEREFYQREVADDYIPELNPLSHDEW